MNKDSLIYWYFSKKALPYWCILLLDCLIVYLSFLLVYTLNTGIYATLSQFGSVLGTLAVYLLLFVICFRIFSTYAGILRYSSFTDLKSVASAMLLGLFLSLGFKYALAPNLHLVAIRAKDIVYGTFLSTCLIWGIRMLVKLLHDSLYHEVSARKIFIFGVKDGGISIAKSIRNQDPPKYRLTGFASDKEDGIGRVLMGVKVYPYDIDLPKVMQDNGATALFVSPLRADAFRENPDIVDALVAAGISIYMMPTEQEWDGKSDIAHQQMREMQIEDLLPREQINVDLDAIAEQLKSSRILITGAAGSIGSEIVRQVSAFKPAELMLIDQAETPLHDIRLMMARDFAYIKATTIVADIANRERMEQIFEEFKPEYVFHAAAYKHVPMMEDNPGEAVHNNVEGTRIIADLAVKYGTKKFVMVSTDKAVNPTNVMGCSKRICEIYVQSLNKAEKDGKHAGNTQFVTTRFGNVLGSSGSVIPLFKEQIKKGGPVTVTHPDIIRYFMLIPEACKLVLEAGTLGNGGEIFVFDMGEPVKIVDLAKRMIKLSGTKCEIAFTGLRDGEKLFEEVLNEKETTLPTVHPKIKVAKVREYDYDDINMQIDELISHCKKDNDMDIVLIMKRIVPEFKSQQSKYTILD